MRYPFKSMRTVLLLFEIGSIISLTCSIFVPWGKVYISGRPVIFYLIGVEGAVTSNTFSYWWDFPTNIFLLFAFILQIVSIISMIYSMYNIKFMVGKNNEMSYTYFFHAKTGLAWSKLMSISSVMNVWMYIIIIALLPTIQGRTENFAIYPLSGTFITFIGIILIFAASPFLAFIEKSDEYSSKTTLSKAQILRMIKYNIDILIHNVSPLLFGFFGMFLVGIMSFAPLASDNSYSYEYSLLLVHTKSYIWGGGTAEYSYSWWDTSIYKDDLVASHLNSTITSLMTIAVITGALALLFGGIALYSLSHREKKELKLMRIFFLLGGISGILTIGSFWLGIDILYSSSLNMPLPEPTIGTYLGIIGASLFFVSAVLLKYIPSDEYNIFSLSE